MSSWLEGLFWANIQIAVLAAVLIVPATILSTLLGKAPASRKGIWLAVLLIPPAAIVFGLLLPTELPSLLPVNWVAPASGALRTQQGVAASSVGHQVALTIFGTCIGLSLFFE